MPEREDDSEVGRSSWSESANEASSRESRPGRWEGFWISEKPGGGMVSGGEVTATWTSLRHQESAEGHLESTKAIRN